MSTHQQSSLPMPAVMGWEVFCYKTTMDNYGRLFTVLTPWLMRKQDMHRSERSVWLWSGHDGHMGIVKCHVCAKQSVWWPGIGKALKKWIEHCKYCHVSKPAQNRELLMPFILLNASFVWIIPGITHMMSVHLKHNFTGQESHTLSSNCQSISLWK